MDRGAPVVVALSPRIYSTAIARLLRHEGFEDVVVVEPDATAVVSASLAVVDGSGAAVDADVVIHLPGTGDTGEQVVLDLRGHQAAVVLDGPAALVEYLRGAPGTIVG